MKKRLLCLLLALAMCLSLLPGVALAAGDAGTGESEVKPAATGPDLKLKSLEARESSGGDCTISPAFDPDTYNYTITVSETSSALSLKPTLPDGVDATQYRWRTFSEEGKRNTVREFKDSFQGYGFNKGMAYPAAPEFELRLETTDAKVLNTYYFQIKGRAELNRLVVEGGVAERSFSSKRFEHRVTVPNDPNTVLTVTPTLKNTNKGHTMMVNGAAATSGEPVTLKVSDLTFTTEGEEQICRIPIHITAGPDTMVNCPTVDGDYTLILVKGPAGNTPTYITQPDADTSYQYYVGDSGATLEAIASASGAVTYQWYSNTTNSTTGGTPIQGATDKTYTLPTETAGKTYYYCVATNTDTAVTENNTATSNVVTSSVFAAPTLTVSWDTEIPDLPTDKGDIFGENTKGYYLITGQTEDLPTLPLKLVVDGTLPDGASTPKCYAEMEYPGGSSYASVTNNTVAVQADKAYGPCVYTAYAEYSFGGRTRTSNKITVFVYVDEAPDLTDYAAIATSHGWTGSGTEADPWILADKTDLEEMRTEVNTNGVFFTNRYFKLNADMDLGDWTPIGSLKPDQTWARNGMNTNPFSGHLDCDNHTLTFAEGSKPLFGYVREASVKNLKIKAPYMASFALVNNYETDYGTDGQYGIGIGGSYQAGCPDTIDIDNVTLLSGSVIQKGGFLGGFASGGNVVNITNCLVEEGVKVGYEKTADGVVPSKQFNAGSIAGEFNGTITNCVSRADVSAISYAGGIVATKGQSMGPFVIRNCAFFGTVEATGDYPDTVEDAETRTECAGAIVGAGYYSISAPNTPCSTVENCYAEATVTSNEYAGGITGGEPACVQCWPNGMGYVRNNVFSGTVTGAKAAGGVIGFMNSLNKYNVIANNYYLSTAATKGIGAVNTENVDTTSEDFGRADDPLGADADKLTMAKTADELKDGSVVDLLNNGEGSLKNWVQGADYPVHSDEPVVYKLAVSGEYKNEYYIGEELDLSGIVLTATWSDGTTTSPALADVKVTGFDSSKRGIQTLTISYGAAEAEIKVTVLKKPSDNKITVSFTLLGDAGHGEPTEETGTHTMAAGNLTEWIAAKEYEVDLNATVLDVVQLALEENEMTCSNPSGNYIESITRGDVTLGEFTNGSLSGWMYTLNGVYSDLGVSEQFLEDGDEIVFHYTDDYTQERTNVKFVFNDLVYSNGKEHWGMDAIQYVYDNGLMNGMKADQFGPDVQLDRSQLVTILWRMEGSPKVTPKKDFADVSKTASNTAWFYDAVAWASTNGIVNGKSETTFDPFALVTREQAAAMFHRYATFKDKASSEKADLSKFADANKISSWAKDDLAWANSVGLINGQSATKLAPLDGATRTEAATILMRFCEQIMK